MRDVVPPNERSIRNIPVPAHRKRQIEETELRREVPQHDPYEERELPPDNRWGESASVRPKRSGLLIWIVAAVIIGVLLAVLLSYLFAGATVTITPKREQAAAGTAVVAKLNAPVGTLPYQTITQSVTGSRTVPTSGEAPVSKRASGTVTVSNAYSATPQRLIKNTRFEAANGKIYRIDESVEVPGGTKQSDGSITPGTVSVQIFADSPGADYNQGITTFTIPGFKGDPRYSKFTAQSTTPLTDGFVGTQQVVSDSDLKSAREGITAELTPKIVEVLKQNVPEGFVYVDGSEYIASEELPRGSGGSGSAVVSIRGTGSAAVVKSEYLASALLKASSKDYTGEAVYFAKGAEVAVSSSAPLNSDLAGDLTLSLKAAADVLWQFDGEALRSSLVGAPASNLQTIMQQYKPAVEQASVSLRPVWTSTFPKEVSKIDLEVKN